MTVECTLVPIVEDALQMFLYLYLRITQVLPVNAEIQSQVYSVPAGMSLLSRTFSRSPIATDDADSDIHRKHCHLLATPTCTIDYAGP